MKPAVTALVDKMIATGQGATSFELAQAFEVDHWYMLELIADQFEELGDCEPDDILSDADVTLGQCSAMCLVLGMLGFKDRAAVLRKMDRSLQGRAIDQGRSIKTFCMDAVAADVFKELRARGNGHL